MVMTERMFYVERVSADRRTAKLRVRRFVDERRRREVVDEGA